MDAFSQYEEQLRERITQLRLQKGVSEHRMSLDLGKSGAYIRSITNGSALPSMRELFNIIGYFHMTPAEFFQDFGQKINLRAQLNDMLLQMEEDDLEKVLQFTRWIQK